jgi:hypothetical protein
MEAGKLILHDNTVSFSDLEGALSELNVAVSSIFVGQ